MMLSDKNIVNIFLPCLVALASSVLIGCSQDITKTAEYQVVCHGKPLTSIVERYKALDDGFDVDPKYKCITKASYDFSQQQEANRKAANTPEVLAKKKAEDEIQHAKFLQEQQQRSAQRLAEREAKQALSYELRAVEINSASVAELAQVCSIQLETAEKIAQERIRAGQFTDWADVVHRVVALSSAQNAVFASSCGLTVNGQSLDGAPADEDTAQMIFQRYLR